MGRKPKASTEDKLAWMTDERVLVAAKLGASLGVTMVTYGITKAIMLGYVEPATELSGTKTDADGGSWAWTIHGRKKMGGKIKDIGKWIESSTRSDRTSYTLNWTSLQQLYKDVRDWDARRTEHNRATVDAAIKALQKLIGTAEEEVARYNNNVKPLIDILNVLIVGFSLAVGGTSYWMLSHPEIIKQMIISMEKVTVRAIDETSEVIEGFGSVVDGLFPDSFSLGGSGGGESGGGMGNAVATLAPFLV